jgi:hypothetical protein
VFSSGGVDELEELEELEKKKYFDVERMAFKSRRETRVVTFERNGEKLEKEFKNCGSELNAYQYFLYDKIDGDKYLGNRIKT